MGLFQQLKVSAGLAYHKVEHKNKRKEENAIFKRMNLVKLIFYEQNVKIKIFLKQMVDATDTKKSTRTEKALDVN